MQNMGKPYDESKVIGIEFYNRMGDQKKLWIEPSCIEVLLDSKTEYRVEADDMEYRIEFSEEHIILYLQYRFGPKVYKRPYSAEINNNEVWVLDSDYSNIN
jgi:hypothetical protein